MNQTRFTTHIQASRHASPWALWPRIRMVLWDCCWAVFCRWTPKPFNSWRLIWLRVFGATIQGRPFVHQRARIQIPWNLTLCDRAAIGDRASIYSLGRIEIGEEAVIAQEAYLCTGTHDFNSPKLTLVTAPIVIGANAFVAARAFIMPGIVVGTAAVVGACSVVTRDVEKHTVVSGNPARFLKIRAHT